MGSIKTVTENEVARVMAVATKQYKKIVWHTSNITIKYSLGMKEYIDLFHAIIDGCTSPSGECVIAIVDFSIRVNVISAYSNVELPSDSEKLFDAVYSTDLYDIVCKNANTRQIESIVSSIYRMIDIWGDKDVN